jgi:hypothetical protein
LHVYIHNKDLLPANNCIVNNAGEYNEVKKERAGVKLSSWPETGSDGDVLLTPYVPKGITGYDDDDDNEVRNFN